MFSLWLVSARFIHNKFQDLLEELACHEKTVKKSDLRDSSDRMKPANIHDPIDHVIYDWNLTYKLLYGKCLFVVQKHLTDRFYLTGIILL